MYSSKEQAWSACFGVVDGVEYAALAFRRLITATITTAVSCQCHSVVLINTLLGTHVLPDFQTPRHRLCCAPQGALLFGEVVHPGPKLYLTSSRSSIACPQVSKHVQSSTGLRLDEPLALHGFALCLGRDALALRMSWR